MVVVGPTLKEFATPDLQHHPLYIVNPNLEVIFELKSRLIHSLPIFRGLDGEDLKNT